MTTTSAYIEIYRDCYHAGDPESAEAAAYLAATIDQALNPSDGDETQESLLAQAVWTAAAFIEAQPCTCDTVDPYEDGPCDRCHALGRIADRQE